MEHQKFASVLKNYINESKLTISSLSRYSNVNRTLIQKFIAGSQLPSNYETLEKILNHLALTPSQKDQLKQLYKIEKIGLEKYEQLSMLDCFMNNLSLYHQYHSNYYIQVNLKQQLNQAKNREELKLLLYSFLTSINDETLDLLLNIDDVLYPVILQFIKQKKFNIRIILCLSSQYNHYSFNLLQLKKLLPLLEFKNIEIHYTYLDNPNQYSLYPFSISSKKQLLLINHSISQGILVDNFNFQKEFDYKFINTHNLIDIFHNETSNFKNILNFNDLNQKPIYYCGDLFLLPYLDEQLLENHYIGKPKYKHELINNFIEFKENIIKNGLCLYCQLPPILDDYLPLGLPSQLFKPFSKNELKLAYYNLLNDLNTNSKIEFITFKKNNIFAKDVIIQTSQTKTLIKNNHLSFNILESSINQGFERLPYLLNEFKEVTYTKEKSIQYLSNYINNL